VHSAGSVFSVLHRTIVLVAVALTAFALMAVKLVAVAWCTE